MVRFTTLLLVSALISTYSVAETHGKYNRFNDGEQDRAKGTAGLSTGLVREKISARDGQPGFKMPDNAAKAMDRWYENNSDMLQFGVWSDSKKVSDEDVARVKHSLAIALRQDGINEFEKKVNVGVNQNGSIRIVFKSTGQTFTFTPSSRLK